MLPLLLSEFNTESKIIKLKAIAFPRILPLVRGYHVPEGDIDNDELYKTLGYVHDSFAYWGFLHRNQYVITSEFIEKNCPVPNNAFDTITHHKELLLTVLFKSKHDTSGSYSITKAEVNKFILQNKKGE